MASRALLLKKGVPVNGRLQAMVKLIQSVENRIYHNEATARRAKSVMNAVGVLLQELPALLEKSDEDHDGFNYVLFDLGKQVYVPAAAGGVKKGRGRPHWLTPRHITSRVSPGCDKYNTVD